MSGTSLDGLDIAACKFNYNKHWNYQIIKALTIKYPDELKHELSNAFYSGDQQLTQLDDKYGNYIGTQLQEFILGLPEIPELICSHGHTVFHRPADGITIQIGSGKRIVEFFSVAISVKVCKYLNCNACGCLLIISEASANFWLA